MDHCVVVGEGYDSADNTTIFAYVAFDGCATWMISLEGVGSGELSVMQISWVDASVGLIGGTCYTLSGRILENHFWKTNDGGKV